MKRFWIIIVNVFIMIAMLVFVTIYSYNENKNLDDAFSYAHGLKGILANLSLIPILNPIIDITEHLRNREKLDYSSYLSLIEEKRKELEKLLK